MMPAMSCRRLATVALLVSLYYVTLIACFPTKIGPRQLSSDPLYCIAYQKGIYLVSTGNCTWVTTDIKKWSIDRGCPRVSACSDQYQSEGRNIVAGNGAFVAFMRCGLYYSKDSINWRYGYDPKSGEPESYGFTGKEFYALYGDLLVTSVEGDSWNREKLSLPEEHKWRCNGIFKWHNEWYLYTCQKVYLRQDNGSYEEVFSVKNENQFIQKINVAGDLIYITVKRGASQSEPKYGTYMHGDFKAYVGAYEPESIATNGSAYVAIGKFTNEYSMMASHNGEEWFFIHTPYSVTYEGKECAYVSDVTWADGKFLAVGAFKSVIESKDGFNWIVDYVSNKRHYYGSNEWWTPLDKYLEMKP